MRPEKLFFILSILGVLLIIFIGGYFEGTFEGEIIRIGNFNGGLTLEIEGVGERVVVFSEEVLDLKVGDKVRFTGRVGRYLGKDQIIVLEMWALP